MLGENDMLGDVDQWGLVHRADGRLLRPRSDTKGINAGGEVVVFGPPFRRKATLPTFTYVANSAKVRVIHDSGRCVSHARRLL